MPPVGFKREISRRGVGRGADVFWARYEKTNDKWWELKAVRLDIGSTDGLPKIPWPWTKCRRPKGLNPAQEKYGWPKVVTKWDEKLWERLEITG